MVSNYCNQLTLRARRNYMGGRMNKIEHKIVLERREVFCHGNFAPHSIWEPCSFLTFKKQNNISKKLWTNIMCSNLVPFFISHRYLNATAETIIVQLQHLHHAFLVPIMHRAIQKLLPTHILSVQTI